MTRQQLYTDTYESIYSDYIEEGLSLDDAQARAYGRIEVAKELIEEALEDLDPFWYHIRRAIPVEYIPNWDALTGKEKEGTLHQLGFDTRMPWRKEDIYYRNNDGHVAKGDNIVGSERVDKKWIESDNASWEATLEYQEFVHGSDHKKDLQRMNK